MVPRSRTRVLLLASLLGAACAALPAPDAGAQARPLTFEDTATIGQLRDSIAVLDRREAQLLRQRDWIRATIAAGDAADSAADAAARVEARAERDAGVLLLLAPLAGYALGAADRDAGGYEDGYRFALDKQAHCFGAGLVQQLVERRGVGRWRAAVVAAVFAGAVELGQRHGFRPGRGRPGYASGPDAAYGAGCALGAAAYSWRFGGARS
jgi:hypothetical protein